MRRTRFLIAALALCAAPAAFAEEAAMAAPAAAQAPALEQAPVTEPAPAVAVHGIVLGPQGVDDEGRVGRIHTVTRGNTLWDISNAYLGTPWVWPSVWKDNHAIANPHLIHPGDRIWITADEMRVVSDDEADEFLERLLEAPAAPAEDLATDSDTDFESAPTEEVAPSEPVLAAIPDASPSGRRITVSTRAAMGFVSAEQLAGASSIVESPNEKTFLAEGDPVYLGVGEGDTQVGDRFTIFESVEIVRDVDSNRVLGHHVDVLGWLEVRELTGDTSIGEIVASYSEVRRGARILARPVPSRFVTMMRTPEANPGQIVFLPSTRTVMADGGYVYLNRGELHGLEIGSELEVFDESEIRNDPARGVDVQTPEHKVGTVVVVSVESETAVAYVLNSSRELEVGDAVRPVTARMAAR
jgi:LysM domain